MRRLPPPEPSQLQPGARAEIRSKGVCRQRSHSLILPVACAASGTGTASASRITALTRTPNDSRCASPPNHPLPPESNRPNPIRQLAAPQIKRSKETLTVETQDPPSQPSLTQIQRTPSQQPFTILRLRPSSSAMQRWPLNWTPTPLHHTMTLTATPSPTSIVQPSISRITNASKSSFHPNHPESPKLRKPSQCHPPADMPLLTTRPQASTTPLIFLIKYTSLHLLPQTSATKTLSSHAHILLTSTHEMIDMDA